MKRIQPLWLSCTAICFACQPLRIIEMESAGVGPVESRWKLNDDCSANNPFFLHNSTDLTCVLQAPPRKIKMSSGAEA